MSTATPEASQVDSVAVPRLALDHLQTALPAGPTARTPHDSPPEQQRRRPDDDDPLVEFNVGGAHYVTSLSTLAAISGSAFASVVEDQQARRGRLQGDEEGEDAIATFDRDGASFRWVLIYLRWVSTGSAPPLALPQDAGERQQLAEEAAFYGLPELEKCCRRPRISQFELMQVRHMQGRYLSDTLREVSDTHGPLSGLHACSLPVRKRPRCPVVCCLHDGDFLHMHGGSHVQDCPDFVVCARMRSC